MAISLVHPMFLLILSLFFLPTLLAIPFDDCGLLLITLFYVLLRFESYPIKVTGVELFEEQYKASFNITVSTITFLMKPFFWGTDKVITGGIVHLQVQYGYKTIMDHTYKLSELITCPVHLVLLCFLFANNFLTQKK
ncbi:hypothetical protein HID58_033095 [Brassica napus]|uniref:Uncharacterized protein n=1 Tax=Brassica napus TaxID=3708 RepID=A0ABQ8BY88_BRANA|nr:hypothetical protein HID58_033095 [Brassica napus]